MGALSDTLRETVANKFRTRVRELHQGVDPRSDDQLRLNPVPTANSVGQLVLDLTGNLSY